MPRQPTHIPGRDEIEEVLRLVHDEAARYLATLDERPVRSPGVGAATASFERPLPEQGSGAAAALRELLEEGLEATVASAGPRCFHFVIGGSTPARSSVPSGLSPSYSWPPLLRAAIARDLGACSLLPSAP